MAAYAALVSLMHIIDQIQLHPRPPTSLDEKQVQSLRENLTFLQNFLECCSNIGSKEADGLESRIADAAYAAEDVIESHIVDQIRGKSTYSLKEISSTDSYQGLQEVIKDMDLIKKEVVQIIEEKMGVEDQLHRNSSTSVGSVRSASAGQNSTIVVFDDVLNEFMDKLTGQQSDLQIIPIVGMGGIGKTTLTRYIYVNSLIVKHFDILAWVTVSQEYSIREILLQALLCQEDKWSMKDLTQMSEDKLGVILHKELSWRRYLVVMDDMWSIEAWDEIKFFFPNNNNGSRIMITTRLSNLAIQLSGSSGFEMDFLDEDKSWNLLCKNVFGEEGCPVELEEIGKKIAKSCKGLPLSIVVIGGLLSKSKRTLECWKCTLENLSLIINVENNEHCLRILYASYKELPIYLKPCFLYVGVFPEDNEIRVSELIKLWVAEGFLRPIDGKSLEVVAEEYFKELIDRNLILDHKLGSNGKTKSCKIHDLLRDLCLREARKQNFLQVTRPHELTSPQGISIERRICIHESTSHEEHHPQLLHDLQSASLSRSLSVHFKSDDFRRALRSADLRLLRVFKVDDGCSNLDRATRRLYSIDDARILFNLRHFSSPNSGWLLNPRLHRFWNLHNLIARNVKVIAFPEIWMMPLLKNVEFGSIDLSDPFVDDFVLENLQTLLTIRISDCREKVIERIPNIKKLKIHQTKEEIQSFPCLDNLSHLHKLETLHCSFNKRRTRRESPQNLTFPHSLKKLTLEGSQLPWEDLATKIGSLPNLEVLKLKWDSFRGSEWETFEGQFCSLRFLLICGCRDLEYWTTDSSHFPRLEHLHLRYLKKLKEIPFGIGDIPTLQSIQLVSCSHSVAFSAKEIQEEQEGLGNEGIWIRAKGYKRDRVIQSFASDKFQVENWY